MNSFIKFENITKQYKETLALDDVSFSIAKGKCTGLLGVNGAGKTTTLKILSGLLQASQGNVYYQDTAINSSEAFLLDYKGKIGYLSQHPKFYEWMTGIEYLRYISDLYGIGHSEKGKRIDEALEIVNLVASKNKAIKGYSGGMKQRLGIAQAILNKPSFLILDEPVSALDPEGRFQIIKLLETLKEQTTILLSTHILHDADSLCDDVIILHEGKKLIETTLTELKSAHQEPIIKVTTTKPIADLEGLLRTYDWIENIDIENTNLALRVSNKEKALNELPIILLNNNHPFSSFQMFEPKLEDIFLKLVSNQ